MLPWEGSTLRSPFELWREDGLLFLSIAKGTRLGVQEVKELLRLVYALDPRGTAPVLVECKEEVMLPAEAAAYLRRSCIRSRRSLGLHTLDLDVRLQGEVFKRLQRPSFPFRVFAWREDALCWVRERKQLVEFNTTSGCS
jgi:hypothetical protein